MLREEDINSFKTFIISERTLGCEIFEKEMNLVRTSEKKK